ncbi:MAG: cAMP-binding proteins - catabolite gene activator and regulatory subunit of cAMP-dependent protein kinases [uncultured Sphingosinicella sp.]|uniref:cAMP-binding proteins - catabolite gene activator and regulatory subunit of cAMP-dependent protein kinases n=1 Tax=uncultured Sphingosinicella sp. TaxID=478748 RepID=A0A6J4U8C3_9SPHN|nr:Crp/Fnr family transcriptional regulator [uncultured Sphingosinicella sp.]CAA9542615.1 MAG: cAMP-binding proteins - catabolite gene activator and regulatory subunit of cAMP-dependent protein kinases [uncultured Sphingosinicella sp.]
MANDLLATGDTSGMERLLRKLRTRDLVSDKEEEVLRASVAEIVEFPANRVIVKAGVTLSHCTLLIDGMVARYKDLADGQRQIMELHVPGDFLDLHSFLLKRLEHNVGAITAVRAAIVPHDTIRVITEEHPHLGRMLWFSTLLDAAIHRERILSVGRRSAVARIAHLICELQVRLELVGLSDSYRFPLPLTQADLGDATGLTSVHVNRMLKQLRDEELLTFRSGAVVIQDWERLQRLAEFTPDYLYLERRPR